MGASHLVYVFFEDQLVPQGLSQFFFRGEMRSNEDFQSERGVQVSWGRVGGAYKVAIDCIASFLNNMGIFKLLKFKSDSFYSFLKRALYFTIF